MLKILTRESVRNERFVMHTRAVLYLYTPAAAAQISPNGKASCHVLLARAARASRLATVHF